MAGKNTKAGRPRKDDPKMNTPSYCLKQSTIIEIDLLSEKLNISRSELLQHIIESGLNIVKITQK